MNEVYIDILLLENFLVNYLLLYLLKRYLHFRRKRKRLVIASSLGAIYVLTLFLPNAFIIISVFGKVIVASIMIITAFAPINFKSFVQMIFLFYLEAFIFAGAILSVNYLIIKPGSTAVTIDTIMQLNSFHVILGSTLSILVVKLGFDFFENYYQKEKDLVEITAKLSDMSFDFNALIDTGNSLKDPVNNNPVIIIYYKTFMKILQEKKGEKYIYDYFSFWNMLQGFYCKERIMEIPFNSIGCTDGKLIALEADFILIKKRKDLKRFDKIMIAFSEHKISDSNEYEALAFPYH